jgi:hypothetical protein
LGDSQFAATQCTLEIVNHSCDADPRQHAFHRTEWRQFKAGWDGS